MKNIIALALVMVGVNATFANSGHTLKKPNVKTIFCGTGYDMDSPDFVRLLNAIATVESGNDLKAIGDWGAGQGAWQLHEVAVKHVNEKFHTSYVWPVDALNPITARQIAKHYLIICGYGKKSLEETVRRWNGGGKHWQSDMAEKYYKKVKTVLERTAR